MSTLVNKVDIASAYVEIPAKNQEFFQPLERNTSLERYADMAISFVGIYLGMWLSDRIHKRT